MRPREEERKKTPSTSFEHIAQSIYQMYKNTLDNCSTKNTIEVGEHPEIEKCLPITYEKFEETIKAIKEYWDFQNGVYQFGIDMYNIAPDRVVEKTVELLEMIMSDTKNHWISYFLFDLDCGKEFEMGTVILNNEAIPLGTTKDLWNLLLTEMAFSLENSIK